MHRATLLAAATIASMIPPGSSVASLSAMKSPPAASVSTEAASMRTEQDVAARGVPTLIAWHPSPRNVPSILDRVETVAVAAGDAHDLALTRRGSVVAWGANGRGQAAVPATLDGASVTEVGVGEAHSLALTAEGSVVAWGWNRYGQSDVPVALDGVTVTHVAAGGRHNLALTAEGSVVAWGWNRYGQSDVPAALDGVTVTQVAAGQARPRGGRPGSTASHNLALTADGRVVAWGANGRGQADVPAALDGVTVTQVAVGGHHSLALTADGGVAAWGGNRYGQTDVPAALDGITVTQVAAGERHSLALTAGGRIVAWGMRASGVPAILDAVKVTEIAAGGRGSLAVGRYEGPDLKISHRQAGPYNLNNAYNTGGPIDLGGRAAWGDVVGESFCLRQPRRFFVRVHNDASASSSFRLRSSSRAPSRVRYHYRGTDITSRLRSTAGFVLDIPPGLYRSVTMDLTLGRCPYPAPRRTKAFLTAQRDGHPQRIDRVRATLRIFW